MNLDTAFSYIQKHYLVDEKTIIDKLSAEFKSEPAQLEQVQAIASDIVGHVRQNNQSTSLFQDFMNQYHLGSKEGVLLMCLSESLLRIPDSSTANRLIQDKITNAEWDKFLGQSGSFLVNASSWGLMLTGKLLSFEKEAKQSPSALMKKMIKKSSEPFVRGAIQKAMTLMGQQFVMGNTIEEALARSNKNGNKDYWFSFDMLGEAALTQNDANRFFVAYKKAIEHAGQLNDERKAQTSLSIKLSALHPRYEWVQYETTFDELYDKLYSLATLAKNQNVAITIDAEEATRLEFSLKLFETLFSSPEFSNWNKLGLAVQAYQKQACWVIEWLATLAQIHNKVIPIRLVKGAYWDTEIKYAQQKGLPDYPVFTTKPATDLSYLVCAQKLLQKCELFYPQFATHNAHTIASILAYQQAYGLKPNDFEFQRLHGMGEAIYDYIMQSYSVPCRVYAPVGNHKELLPYLIRRLLENGANSSFVHHLNDEKTPIASLIQEPLNLIRQSQNQPSPIPTPPNLYGKVRPNSLGFEINVSNNFAPLLKQVAEMTNKQWYAKPIVNGQAIMTQSQVTTYNPTLPQEQVGQVNFSDEKAVKLAMQVASESFVQWNSTPATQRAKVLNQVADLLEANRAELIALCQREAGKCWQDAIDEIREAVDFCRYYAVMAKKEFNKPKTLPGPTGELNQLSLEGKGVFLCISPWNFPVAIFTGQVAAALAAGNTVIAKPAEQTSLVAHFTTQLFYQAGVPKEVLHFLPGDGAMIGSHLTTDPLLAGVAFTGSTETAKVIQKNLAQKDGPIATLIAETGGQNAMITDSSALAEQVVKDVIASTFQSAGQRCSALRVLFLQEDVADEVLSQLKGALTEQNVGNPQLLETDIGPVINAEAQKQLNAHIEKFKNQGKLYFQLSRQENNHGHFVYPAIITLDSLSELAREVFGPVLHVIRYHSKNIDEVINQINQTGYGLTLGIHSRIDSFAEYIKERVRVGNVYINRNMIGAVVGVQPFGGCGLSGTGPKAGGPHYLHQFATEKTITTNTAAIGGNVQLLSG